MRFSIIIPSYLGNYEHAATSRDSKLTRAIDSVLAQSFQDFEIMVIADGCDKTYSIIEEKYIDEQKIDCLQIKKQPLWSGYPRNFGINKSEGEYIAYLDSDDIFGTDHLAIIDSELEANNNPKWVWFNDNLKKKDGTFYERQILINHKFQNGTSNICHKRTLPIQWMGNGYGLDDWSVVQQLQRSPPAIKIKTPQYIVCHLQRGLDV